MMTLEEFGKSDKKLCIFLKREQANKINKLVFNNINCFLVQRDNYSNHPYLLLNPKAYFGNLERNIMRASDLLIISELVDKNIPFRMIKEFDELYLCKIDDNHEKDVLDYNMVKGLIHSPIIKTVPNIFNIAKKKEIMDSFKHFLNGDKLVFPKLSIYEENKQTVCMLIINKDKKYVIYKINNKEYRVDCHKDDEFNWQIGFGLALSKCFGKQYKWQRARENFRHNIINEDDGSVKRVLDYESYSKWCIYEYYHNDTDEIKNLKNKVKEINELGKVDL